MNRIKPFHIATANLWRDQYNPLRGLSLARSVALLEEGQRGQYADLQWLYSFIERRDATLKALVRRRSSALSKLDWDIKVIEESKAAEAQQEYLREVYNGIDNLKEAIKFLALAEFRGFAHLEKQINADGDIFHLEPVPQWHWVREGLNGEWQYNAKAQNVTRGEPIGDRREQFIIREVSDPIDEIALICFNRKNLSQKDWDGYIESYGIPPLFIIGPPNTSKDKDAEYQEIAEQVASDARGYLPNGADVKSPSASERGNNPFRDHIKYQDEQIVLAGTGGKLTMINEATGIGGSQGEVHDAAFDDLALEDAFLISEVFQEQLDALLLMREFPGQDVLAYFEIARDEESEATVSFKREVWKGFQADGTVNDILANQTDLKGLTRDVGLPVNEEYIDPYLPVRDDQGRPVTGEVSRDSEGDIVGGQADGNDQFQSTNDQGRPQGGNDLKGGAALLRNRSETSHVVSYEEEVLRALDADLAPIRKRLEAIAGIEDSEIRLGRMEALLEELPGLMGDITADPAAAGAMARMMAEEMAVGARAATAEREAGK